MVDYIVDVRWGEERKWTANCVCTLYTVLLGTKMIYDVSIDTYTTLPDSLWKWQGLIRGLSAAVCLSFSQFLGWRLLPSLQ